ncbi:hypothetical protein COMA2_40044 [Candidatus Nitrospira nitrificans]|uniref:Uncharacterized protein n=1 Tax=Candidatus Nitrospira nitrificans TaxID=1742973 RepID=A0A0S4LM85_9BACT|nr:hypothetical protein COMA2_40044 [Candidatus Nitrospira nitrificans]
MRIDFRTVRLTGKNSRLLPLGDHEERYQLLSFDSQAAAVGIGGTLGVKRTACAVRIVDGVGRKPRTVPAVGVAG